VERIYGQNRYVTSIVIADTFFDSPSKAVLAYAWTFPDGLSSGPLANALNAPIILVDKNNYSLASEYCSNNSITSGYIMGGSSLVTDNAAMSIFSLQSADEIEVIH
ncbi:MAG: cell wall-binding repeat-containing protein, partial [Erysipelotrichaceae bacterium]|nr:cell wall-binding repeat-containing protein [Erysipelotrichaceae bacterium]